MSSTIHNRIRTTLALATLGLVAISLMFLPLHSAHAATIKSTASPSLQNGLVGYWNFDEGQGSTAHDYSGQGNTGTLTGANGLPTWRQSNTGLGNALKLDGVDDYVDVPDSTLYL